MKKATAVPMGKCYEWMLGSLLIVSIALLSACGGGGGGSGITPGTTTNGVTAGEIEAFGSILVNGVKFEVEGAEVETEHGVTTIISGATQTQHLHEGMQVEVEVEFNDDGKTGTAKRIRIDDELEGEVSGASPTGDDLRTFTILGQTVTALKGVTKVYDDTLLSEVTMDDISNGDFLEIHGLPDGNGNLTASFIKIENPEAEVELTGVIDATNFSAGTYFEINGQGVNYTDSLVDFPPLSAGMMVEVKGSLNASSEIDATLIHVEDGMGNNLAKAEIEGIVRNLDNPNAGEFTLNGQRVFYDNANFFGGTKAELLNGMKVEAEGPTDASGVLQARKIKYKDSVRLEGFATWDAGTNTLSYPNPTGTTLLVRVETPTLTDGTAPAGDGTFRIRGRQLEGEKILATRIDSGGNADRLKVRAATVTFDPAAGTVDLIEDNLNLGTGLVQFNENGTPVYKLDNGSSETILSRAQFYTALAAAADTALVEARYRYPGDLSGFPAAFNGNWDEIVIELDD